MSSLNSLYTLGDGYEDKPFKYVNGFWVSALGMLALGQKFPDSSIIHTYLNRPAPITYDAIMANGQNYTDIIAGAKIIYDNDIMPYSTWLKFVAYFKELSGKRYKNVDHKKFIKLTKEFIQFRIRPHQIIQPTVFGFVAGKIKLEDTLLELYKFNEKYRLSPNFRKFCLLHRKDL